MHQNPNFSAVSSINAGEDPRGTLTHREAIQNQTLQHKHGHEMEQMQKNIIIMKDL